MSNTDQQPNPPPAGDHIEGDKITAGNIGHDAAVAIGAGSSVSVTHIHPAPPAPRPRSWLFLLLILLALIVLLVLLIPRLLPSNWTRPSTYQVRVLAQNTDEPIPNAQVTLEPSGKTPSVVRTDANGLALFLIDPSCANQPGALTIEAAGYKKHHRNITLILNDLPVTIFLEPAH